MGGADREDGAGEVYANGIALDVVRGWLGASASDLDWDTFDDVQRDAVGVNLVGSVFTVGPSHAYSRAVMTLGCAD